MDGLQPGRLPEYTITVSGRGKTALLDAPHSPVQTFGTNLERSAHQLMTQALTLGGVDFGWGVDFGLTDWQIPGGTWLHQGTYLSAILDIAGSVGGYVQPHDTAQTVRILKRWPVPAWRLGELTPDIELPLGLSEVDDTEYIDSPAYNRLFVSGETGSGILADLTRSGTAGDVLRCPMVVHPLITTIGAAKARAQSELSDAGPLVRRRMTLPILPATGIIKPGAVLDYWDDSAARRVGIVDATSINQTWPALVQTLEVMSHA